MSNFDLALDSVMKLNLEEREELIFILNKRNSEEWRKSTAEYSKKLKQNLLDGKLKSYSADEAINKLHKLL